jgi:hypothetical protein
METIHLHTNDNVAIAISDLNKNIPLNNFIIKNFIPKGHKVALQNINLGDKIIKLNHVIGLATKNIKAGEHVHTHNISVGEINTINIGSKKSSTILINYSAMTNRFYVC